MSVINIDLIILGRDLFILTNIKLMFWAQSEPHAQKLFYGRFSVYIFMQIKVLFN